MSNPTTIRVREIKNHRGLQKQCGRRLGPEDAIHGPLLRHPEIDAARPDRAGACLELLDDGKHVCWTSTSQSGIWTSSHRVFAVEVQS